MGNYAFPVFDFSQTATGGCSITGGYVYRGCAYPKLWGYYIFADYCNGQFWAISPNDAGGWQLHTLSNLANLQYTSFGENYLGELFVTAHTQGKIYQVTETTGAAFEMFTEVVDESCEGAADGAVSLTWTSVAEPVTLVWNTLDTTAVIDSLVAGEYCATLTLANGCQSLICAEVGQLSIEAPVITWNDTVLAVPSGFETYQWYLDGTLIEGAEDSTFMPLQSGAYTVEVSTVAGCSALADPFTVVIENTLEKAGAPDWTIHPNPFSRTWDFKLDLSRPQNITLEVFQLNGQPVWKQVWKKTPRIERQIDASSWPSGAYWVRLTTEEGQWVDQLIKQ